MKQNKKQTSQKSNRMGLGIVGGILASAFIATIVSLVTQDSEIWNWAIPVGVAVGTAIGAGLIEQQNDNN